LQAAGLRCRQRRRFNGDEAVDRGCVGGGVSIRERSGFASRLARVTGMGTHSGELMGTPPTGKRLEMTGIVIYRIERGKIVERWAQHDVVGLLRQLGVIPARGRES
jgi:hypothetical protein